VSDDTVRIRVEGDLTLWFQNCDVGFTTETPEQAERLFSVIKSAMELSLPLKLTCLQKILT